MQQTCKGFIYYAGSEPTETVEMLKVIANVAGVPEVASPSGSVKPTSSALVYCLSAPGTAISQSKTWTSTLLSSTTDKLTQILNFLQKCFVLRNITSYGDVADFCWSAQSLREQVSTVIHLLHCCGDFATANLRKVVGEVGRPVAPATGLIFATI